VSERRAPPDDLVVVSDLHLVEDDPDLAAFCTFLEERAEDTGTLVLLGDLFSVWLGREKYTLPHHRVVLDRCAFLRGRGVTVVLIEGNREFGARAWEGRAFDRVLDELATGPLAGRRWLLAHGDLVNEQDRAYRRWRAFARARAVQQAFAALPASLGRSAVRRIEQALSGSNPRGRMRIAEGSLERYAHSLASRGFDGGVVGHFHVEMSLEIDTGERGRFPLLVMPDWRSTRRFLRLAPASGPRFETWGEPRPVPPAIVAVDVRGDSATVLLDRPANVREGARVALSSGHGPDVRGARVTSVDPTEPRRLHLALAPGAALQVGDRLLSGTTEEMTR